MNGWQTATILRHKMKSEHMEKMSKSRTLYRVFNDVIIMVSKRYDATVCV